MLKALQIKNFKGWKDTGEIRMAPLTLFFGANSSGKSSIGQFLMMLKQTVESSDRKAVFNPGGRNSAVQLGSFQELVYQRNLANNISFKYEWDMPKGVTIRDDKFPKELWSQNLRFEAEVGLTELGQQAPELKKFQYSLPFSDANTSFGIERETAQKYKVITQDYTLVRNLGRAWAIGAPSKFYIFPEEVIAYHQNAKFVQDLSLSNEMLFSSLFYLGPLRTKPERSYSWAGTAPDSVGHDGENTISAFLAAQNRRMSLGYRKLTRPFEEIIALKLLEMKLIDDFKVNRLTDYRNEYEVKVQSRGSKYKVDLPDVGFGVSQVLPVLTQLFYAPPNSIIIMEQPEMHLHPSAQSALADVMIDVINSKENGVDRNIQLIIETHSEYFLRRLQRRIAEDVVSQEKIAAYFADNSKTPALLEPLQIDLYGNISNWPKDFFGDEMGDITEQAKAGLRKRREMTRSAIRDATE